MMEASPAPALEMAEAQFLFEFLVVAFHDPTMLGDANQIVPLGCRG